MSKYDNDYDDPEDDDYEDEQDDDGEIRRSTNNPFSSGGASVRGAGLPQRPNPGAPTPGGGGSTGGGGGINTPSPVRSPGAMGGSGGGSGFSRPNPPGVTSGGGTGGSGSGGSSGGGSGVQPFRPSGGSYLGGSGGSSGGGGTPPPGGVARPGTTPPAKDDPMSRVGNALGGLSSKPDDKKDDKKDEKPAGAFGNLGNLGNRFGGAPEKKDDKPDAKKDEKGGGGGFGGLGNRFGGGGDKKDDKPEAKKDDKAGGGLGGALGGLGNRFGGGGDKPDAKKDDKPAGGGLGGTLGGLGNRFGGGDKKDDKPAAKKDDKPAGGGLGGALGGLGSKLPFGGGDKKDDKPAAKKDDKPAGGGFGGLGNRFGGGDKNDKPADAKTSPFTTGGAKPGAPTSSAPASSGGGILGGKLPFGGGGGGAKPNAPATPGGGKAPAAKGGAKGAPVSFSDRLRALNPFKADNDAKKARASKAPKVDATGLTLDNKLDILGVSMVLGSLILLLSSLSPVKGALTSEINRVLSEGFGWGAIGVVLVIFAIGVVLILRHFGDDAPVIPRMRLIGATLLFVGMLVAMQFVHSMRYEVGVGQDYLWTVKNVFLTISWQLGQGGGRIGGEIYFLLISNLSEIGGFLALVLWLTIGLMLSLNMSASDLAIIVISLFRSLGDSVRRRQQRAAAIRAEKAAVAAAAAAAVPQISVSKPEGGQEALPAGATAALPAPIPAPVVQAPLSAPEPERSIPITMGGRTFTAPMRGGEPVPLEPAKSANRPSPTELIAASLAGAAATVISPSPADPETTPSTATPAAEAPKPDADKSGGRFGNFGSRLPFGAKPDDAKKDDKTTTVEKPAAALTGAPPAASTAVADPVKPEAEKSGGIGGRLGGLSGRLPFGAKPDDAKKDDKTSTVEKPAASIAAATPADTTKPEPEKTGGIGGRLGGLSGRLPFGAKPDDAKKDEKPAAPAKPTVDKPAAERVPGPATTSSAAPTPAERPAGGMSRRDQLIAQYSKQEAAAKPADPTPTPTADPVVPAAKPAAEPTSPFAKPAAASTEAPFKPTSPVTPTAKPADPVTPAAKPAESTSPFAKPAEPTSPFAKPAAASTESPFKPAQPTSPFAKPAEPIKPAASQFSADEDDDDDAPPARLGDLLKPRPFERKPLGANEPAKAETPTEEVKAAAESVKPADAPARDDKPLEVRKAVTGLIIDDEEEDETGKWASLPPAKPKSATTETPKTELPSWQSRMNTLSGRPEGEKSEATAKPAVPQPLEKRDPFKADDPPFKVDKPAAAVTPERHDDPPFKVDKPAAVPPPLEKREPLTPAASLIPEKRDPVKADEPKRDDPPFKVDKPAAPMASLTPPEKAHIYAKPEDNPPVKTDKPVERASSAFGKPDDDLPFIATSRPTAPPPSARGILGGVDEVGELEGGGKIVRSKPPKDWKMPSYDDLIISGQDQEIDHNLLLERARTIQETLESFGAPGRVVEVRTGPVITQFGVEPDYVPVRGGKKMRVKVSSIAALDKDIQLALGARSIRVEAPVPGKGYVGIEVPNDKSAIVRLRDVLESKEFKKINSPLAIALGQGVDGTPVAADLASMPHLLIAGTTGSGKSVCVNAIIASLLLKNQPSQVKFIMVDPKRVELTGYNGIPHLVAPVVTELERIVSVLKWVTREMDERYRRFSTAGARNIEDFNKHLPQGTDPLPYIVVIIDELADLMMLAPDETERVITRIAALARATGIHLVIATQRPSVDVVTGLIKANFPARIAFAVASGTDSRVILDQPGADRLLGRGDMLYMSGDSPAPVRMQGVYVSDSELGNITHFWRGQMTQEEMIAASKPLISAIVDEEGKSPIPLKSDGKRGQQSSFLPRQEPDDDYGDDDDDDDDVDDALYNQAVDLVRRQNRASVSLLQRKLRIGYTRAARLIDLMEERGIVGPAVEGAKPREVLLPPPPK